MAKSIKTEFVKFYKEKLEPLGFVKVKGPQPYFVRVVNNEILHVFTYLTESTGGFDYTELHLVCGVATVYRKEINFSVPPLKNADWLIDLSWINEHKDTEYPLVSFPRESKSYYYNSENIETVIKETYEGFKILEEEMSKVTDMDKMLWYLFKYDAKNISFLQWLDDSCFDEESMFFARRNFDVFKIKAVFQRKRKELSESLILEKEERRSRIDAFEQRVLERRERFISSEDDYREGLKLLVKRYTENLSKLSEYGIEIQEKELRL